VPVKPVFIIPDQCHRCAAAPTLTSRQTFAKNLYILTLNFMERYGLLEIPE